MNLISLSRHPAGEDAGGGGLELRRAAHAAAPADLESGGAREAHFRDHADADHHELCGQLEAFLGHHLLDPSGALEALELIGAVASQLIAPPPVSRPDDPVTEGNIAGILQSALRAGLALSPASRSRSIGQFSAIKTRAEARQFADSVREQLRLARTGSSR